MNADTHWQALKNGNRSSLEWLYRTYADQLLRYGYAFTKEDALAEDCLQELYINLWEKRRTLGDTTSVKNYLFASFRRSIWKKQKKAQKDRGVDIEKALPFLVELNIEDQKIEEEQIEESKQKLKAAMTALSSRQKELLYLKYEADLTYDEICEMMDINYQSARNLMSGALQKLRKQMIILLGLIFLWI
jgi:RNA polymerase sigma factor (sigma-70 family)